ncbi:MAG: septation protein A [Gammaproteobacteria bacterium]|nr:septation protein A [Gammaproteobacteria bacterium]
MKFLFDFFPLIAFYAAYKIYDNDIFIATGAIIAATLFQITYNWIKHKKIEKMHVITAVLVTFFGGITILLHDPVFIQWKVSVINWIFGIILFGSQFIGKKPIIERMMSNAITVTSPVWVRLNLSWATFFIGMGFLNWYIFTHYSEATWVDFKVYGVLGLTFAFVILQGIYLARHIEEEPENKD